MKESSFLTSEAEKMDPFMGKGICTQIMCQYLVKLTSSLGAPNPIRSFTASRKVLEKKQKGYLLVKGWL